MRSMKLAFATLAVAASMAFSPAGHAQRAGTYAVEGNEGGSSAATYTGSVVLAPTGPHTWTVTWRIHGEVTNGVGIMTDNILSVGYVTGAVGQGYISTGSTGVAVFIPQTDGTLLGRWTTGRTNASGGNERWSPR